MNWSRFFASALGFLLVIGYFWFDRTAGPRSRAAVRRDTDGVSCQEEKAEVQSLRSEVQRLQAELNDARNRVVAVPEDAHAP